MSERKTNNSYSRLLRLTTGLLIGIMANAYSSEADGPATTTTLTVTDIVPAGTVVSTVAAEAVDTWDEIRAMSPDLRKLEAEVDLLGYNAEAKLILLGRSACLIRSEGNYQSVVLQWIGDEYSTIQNLQHSEGYALNINEEMLRVCPEVAPLPYVP